MATLPPKRILAIDVGAGTQDVFLYEEGKTIENCVKFVLPSPMVVVSKRIERVTAQGKAIFLVGNLMGGGRNVAAVKRHLKAGLKVYAAPQAARTIHDNLDRVKELGIEIADGPSAHRGAPADAVAVRFGDVDQGVLRSVLGSFEIEFPELCAVAVMDHGECLEGSNRKVRVGYLRRFIEEGRDVSQLAFREPPPLFTRMRAVQADLPGCIVMDTGFASIRGSLCDPTVQARADRGVTLVNVGNGHTLVALIQDEKLLGIFEHHTGLLDREKLDSYVRRLQKGVLTDAEVYQDGGHGCCIHPDVAGREDFDFVAVTGPRRGLADGLGYYKAVPFGDVMLTGCFGLVASVLGSDPLVGRRRAPAGQ